MTQIQLLGPELSVFYLLYLVIPTLFVIPVHQNSLLFSFECSCVDAMFQISWQIIPVFRSFNDDVERPSLSFAGLYHIVLFGPRTIFVNGVV